MKKKLQRKSRLLKEIMDYDSTDTSDSVNTTKRLKFEDFGLRLPQMPPTQVVSIRLPSQLLNEIKAIGSQRDVPYQALIKLFLSASVAEMKKKSL